ncbi:MAG: enoyl-CoA hydratase-related protein [Saprospiraceae bacterium]
MFKNILVQEFDCIQLLTINRPEALNALNLKVFEEIKSHLISIEENHKIRCLVIAGSGEKAFIAGADITEFSSIPKGGAKTFLSLGNTVMNLIENFHIPVIAAIKGFALGGGCELAMACHIRIAGEKAKFGMPEINLGILPGYGGTQRLSKLIGKAKAMELILSGDFISAVDALELGLVNKVVADGKEIEHAMELAKKFAGKAPLAVKAIIQAVNQVDHDLLKDIEKESDLFTALADTEDFKEGTTAFLEKRKAVFTGK